MEKIDIIDKQGFLTGEVCDRKDVHKFGLLHQASGVIIVSKTNAGGGIRYYLNKGLSKKRKMQDFGICLPVDTFHLVRHRSHP